ncbi:hypothetical protein MBT84_39460 [Streptomyces sp. MBT84]|uniref:EthD domain-containing protein n=1 Tax=unclassified Streptomyces TaxID=2593676 RepID=UPI001C6ECB41|nr:EthD domain-containing protein [Streptomyces sp. MBT84]MBW8705704.1 hypothetical protein [Streptomyces sp. MBT84]
MLNEAVKMYGFPTRKPGISGEEFHDHWRHPHATLSIRIPTITAYTQCHRIDTALLGTQQQRVDGIAEVWFANAADAAGMPNRPEYRDIVKPDEPNFTDTSTLLFAYVRDEVLSPGAPAGGSTDEADRAWTPDRGVTTKLMIVTEAGGNENWAAERDLALGRSIGALRHVRAWPANELYEASSPLVIGVHELWWPTVSDFERGIARNPAAFDELVDRPQKGFALLTQAEKVM